VLNLRNTRGNSEKAYKSDEKAYKSDEKAYKSDQKLK
jgi:hypothetical protein